jgi:hypothetical protein
MTPQLSSWHTSFFRLYHGYGSRESVVTTEGKPICREEMPNFDGIELHGASIQLTPATRQEREFASR